MAKSSVSSGLEERTGLLLERLSGIEPLLEFTTDPADCWTYGYDNSRRHEPPIAVVFPTRHEHVKQIVAACNDYQVPLTPRGLGSGTAGAAVPVRTGLSMSLERMTEILRIDADNRVAVVQAGVTNLTLQTAAAEHGFFWPPDPTSAAYCTVGGNLALNSAGPRAVKYGTPRENTLGLKAVAGNGDELITGCYTTKGVVGYDLTRLIIGSEGTLAVITEATLKLTPCPETVKTLRMVYSDMITAAAAVSRIMAQPQTPRVLEFLDGGALDMIRSYAQTDLPADGGAMLICEVDGPRLGIEASIASIETAARGDGLVEIRAAKDKEEADALWSVRKSLAPALRTVAPKKVNEDVVVPVSRIADLLSRLKELSRQYDIPIVNFGHAGNGNIHVNLLTDPDNKKQQDNLAPCLDGVFGVVLDLGGTLSGEHGIGLEKRDYLGLEIEPATLELMKRIKKQFDPKYILNPGKLFPDSV